MDTEFARNWVQQRYMTLLKDALFEVTGADLEVEFVIAASDDQPAPASPDEEPAAPVAPTVEMPAAPPGPSAAALHV